VSTANERHLDATIRHAVEVQRFRRGEAREVADILSRADQDLVRKLRRRIGPRFDNTRIKALLDDLYVARGATFERIRKKVRDELLEFSDAEARLEAEAMRRSVGVSFDLAAVPMSALRKVLYTRAFSGRTMDQWFRDLRQADRLAVSKAIQQGVAQGEGVDGIVRRVAGTKARGYTDGALAMGRRRAETVVRSAVNHAHNSAREEVWQANADVVAYVKAVATLDGRTSPVCRAIDGALDPVGDRPLPKGAKALNGRRPPFHPNCRTTTVAVLDGEGVAGRRPYVLDARDPGKRAADFAAEARKTGRPIADVRSAWADRHVGTVPADTTFGQWIKRQSAADQDAVLGKTRGALLRRGGLTVEQYVDRKGDELTISALRGRYPDAFAKANLK